MKKWIIANWRTAAIWAWLLLFMWGLQLTVIFETMPQAPESSLRFTGG